MGAWLKALVHSLIGPLGAIVGVMACGFLLVLAISSDPVLAYRDLLFANFDSASNFALFVLFCEGVMKERPSPSNGFT